MAAFNGKWNLDFTINDDEYMEALGYSAEVIKACAPLSEAGKVEIEYDTTNPKCITNIIRAKDGTELFKTTTPLGKDITVEDGTGTTSKILEHTLTSNQILCRQAGPNGNVALYDTRVDGDKMTEVITIENSKVVAKRTLSRI